VCTQKSPIFLYVSAAVISDVHASILIDVFPGLFNKFCLCLYINTETQRLYGGGGGGGDVGGRIAKRELGCSEKRELGFEWGGGVLSRLSCLRMSALSDSAVSLSLSHFLTFSASLSASLSACLSLSLSKPHLYSKESNPYSKKNPIYTPKSPSLCQKAQYTRQRALHTLKKTHIYATEPLTLS